MRRRQLPWICILIGLVLVGLGACSAPQTREPLEDQSGFHLQLAHGHWGGGEVPQAIEELEIALAIDPTNEDAHFLLAFIYSGRQMPNQAIQHYRQALLYRPDWHECSNNLGVVFLQLERWEDAEPIFQELVQVPSYHTPGHAYNNLGWAQLNQNNTREALSNFEMATYLQPDLCLAYNNQGIAFETLEREREAVDAYETAIRRCDSYTEPYYRLARIHLREGSLEEANELLQTCVELSPEAPLGRRCREYLED